MMKFEDAKVGMKVYINHPQVNYKEGVITAIKTSERAIFVEPIKHKQGDSAWFWEGNYIYSLDNLTRVNNKVPKFDTGLSDSAEFTGYLNALKDKYNKLLDVNTYVTEVSISENGTIKVKDNHGNKAKAKCHPDDAFNLETGMKLAVQRLSEKCPFIPKRGEEYWKVFSTEGNIVSILYYKGFFAQELDIAIGNCFRTEEEAKKHKFEIIDKFRTLLDLTNIMTVGDKV